MVIFLEDLNVIEFLNCKEEYLEYEKSIGYYVPYSADPKLKKVFQYLNCNTIYVAKMYDSAIEYLPIFKIN